MSQATMQDRLNIKTPEAAFLRIMQNEFDFSARVSQEVLQVAEEMLGSSAGAVTIRPGQIRMIVANMQAPFGPPLAETDKVEITLTVDAGQEDAHVKGSAGGEAQRRGRILRMLEEGLEQGGVLTQEDLARGLGVNRRTIVRDVKALKAEGHLVHTRGQLKGVGRGQTHKVRIIELWLDREGYEKVARWMHHSPQAIKRYVSTFLRIVVLHRKGTPEAEIAFLTKCSLKLVRDYLAVYEAALEKPHRREKLEEELARVTGWQKTSAGGAKKGGLKR